MAQYLLDPFFRQLSSDSICSSQVIAIRSSPTMMNLKSENMSKDSLRDIIETAC